jgi:hypothetical protein
MASKGYSVRPCNHEEYHSFIASSERYNCDKKVPRGRGREVDGVELAAWAQTPRGNRANDPALAGKAP